MKTTRYEFLVTSEEVFGFDPCPFCGGGYQEIYKSDDWICSPTMYRYSVRCDCGAHMDGNAEVYPGENKHREIVDTARQKWNRRM